jgi:hypothetical protein
MERFQLLGADAERRPRRLEPDSMFGVIAARGELSQAGLQMKTYLVASLLSVGLITQVLAAQAPIQHFAVRDTVGNCSVLDSQPSKASGLKILGDRSGYKSEADAQKALGSGGKSVISLSACTHPNTCWPHSSSVAAF